MPEPDDIARPEPSAVLESLRSIGYSISTAIADLIDNSIAAGAHNIRLLGFWSLKEPYIVVADDGSGMSEKELFRAMTLGSKSPIEARNAKDLGRFGMGLKTASFSQCRKLTVGSKRANESLVVREWDLDYVLQSQEWLLKKSTDQKALELIEEHLTGQSGTCVIWRNLDRIIDTNNERGKEHWINTLTEVENHLAMVFHRFLSKRGRLKILLGTYEIKPWDPFLASHDFTQEFSEGLTSNKYGNIPVQAYVLPHKSKLSDEQLASAGGIKGWNGQQGLYIYRNDRLLVSGGWAGLGLRSEDSFNLARIAVDIPNTADVDWQLDIKKSRVRPPNELRGRLKQIAEIMQNRSKQTYNAKGKIASRKISGDFASVWKERWKGTRLGFEINRKHPLIKEVLFASPNNQLKAIIRLLEETLPLEQIAFYLADTPTARIEPFEDGTDSDDFKKAVQLLDHVLSTSQMPLPLLQSKLLEIEPFNKFPDLVLSILHRGSDDGSEDPK